MSHSLSPTGGDCETAPVVASAAVYLDGRMAHSDARPWGADQLAETEDPVGWYDSNAAEVDGQ